MCPMESPSIYELKACRTCFAVELLQKLRIMYLRLFCVGFGIFEKCLFVKLSAKSPIFVQIYICRLHNVILNFYIQYSSKQS